LAGHDSSKRQRARATSTDRLAPSRNPIDVASRARSIAVDANARGAFASVVVVEDARCESTRARGASTWIDGAR
jgi:hypothetical protein